MTLELTHPYCLFLLLAAGILCWNYRCSLIDFSRVQRRVSLLVRLGILVLFVLALAGLTLNAPTHERMLVFLQDQSRSIDEDATRKADEYLAAIREKADRVAGAPPMIVLPFAETPRTPSAGGEKSREKPLSATSERPAETPVPEGKPEENRDTDTGTAGAGNESELSSELSWKNATDITAAVEPALALVPPRYVPHLVLLSDGNETAGNILATAARGDFVISSIPLPASEKPEVQLAELKAPSQVREGEPFLLEAVVRSNRETEGKITLFRGPYKVAEERHPLKIGENVIPFKQSLENRRQQEYSVTVESKDDSILDNNHASALVYAGGKPRLLLIESDTKTARDLAAALREQDIETEIRPPEGIPRSLDELEEFEAVVLSNVPATSLSMRQMDLLRTYVADLGGGFFMLGGEQSFGLGGYYKTPIEEILPVRSDFEKEKEKPSLAICLVIDRSGSMGGEKMELAKDAAKSAVELLSPRDFASVVAFDHDVYVVVPIQSAAASGSINSTISTIEAAGGTYIYPGLVAAHEQLRQVSAKLKHVILLTDGQSEEGDYEGIVGQMVADQMTVSTVGVGDADNELLKSIAENGKGRHYTCDDPQAIPQIFAKETITASKSAIHEIPFVPVLVTPNEALAGIALDTAPPLLGFVVTRPKPTSQFILATETGEPLLAWWRYGLGISAAFTSDAKSRWGAEWLTWPDFGKFWAQLVRHTMRKSEGRGSRTELIPSANGARLVLDYVDESGRYVNDALGRVTMIRPDLSKEEILLSPTAPGRYEAEIAMKNKGGYHLHLSLFSGEKMLLSQSRGIMVSYPEELRLRPTNTDLLRRLAASSGGWFEPEPETLFEDDPVRTAWKTTPVWPYLLCAALLLFVFDVLLRRIDFGRRTQNRKAYTGGR
ncbi:MAG TPA: chloride channel protein [Planctomycetaceae bacterium]|nr:chloride channel protein [Planctomycetaceae bacterium]